MDDTKKTYEQGLLEGQIDAMEKIQSHHADRLDHHEKRLTAQERISFGLLGALVLLEVLPTIRAAIEGAT